MYERFCIINFIFYIVLTSSFDKVKNLSSMILFWVVYGPELNFDAYVMFCYVLLSKITQKWKLKLESTKTEEVSMTAAWMNDYQDSKLLIPGLHLYLIVKMVSFRL